MSRPDNARADQPSPVLLVAVYTAPGHRLVRVEYREAGDHTFATLGDVSDAECLELAAAEGADVAGWTNRIEI